MIYYNISDATGIISDDGKSLLLEVVIPPLDFTVVEFTPQVVNSSEEPIK